MLYKYALFTAIMSVLPFLFIINDVSNFWGSNVLRFLHHFISTLPKILSTLSDIDKTSQPEAKLDLLFTEENIKSYTGEVDKNDLYLVILGNVFDVSKGKRFYGPGGDYHPFIGNTKYLLMNCLFN